MNDNFFYGVVEDRNDPLMLGRLRVRIFGLHSHRKAKSLTDGIPTDELLWCYPIQPITSAAISGIGDSPTGPVEGTNVVGFFRDQMYQDGVIMGTIGGIPQMTGSEIQQNTEANTGFCDPNYQYPRYAMEPDTNVLARGGVNPYVPTESGQPTLPPASVEEQNLNKDTANEPDKRPAEDIPPNPPPGDFTIEEMLRGDEGVRVKVYWDHLGYPTVGIGHLIIHEVTRDMNRINKLLSNQVGRTITDGRITNDEISKLFDGDLSSMRREIARNTKVNTVYTSLDETRKMAIENMCFQMGVGGVAKFNNALAAMLRQDWNTAYNEMLDSTWAKQTPQRALRVSKIILHGNLESYGVVAGTFRTRSYMFEEPDSPYNAKYPYNHVYESESGHIQEFDDTDGAERYHRRHPVGTFEEIHPDGTRVVKIIGEDYLIVNSNRNLHVVGNINIVVDGDAQVYIAGNSEQTIGGNVTQLVRGDVTEQIDGNVSSTVNGNVNQLIKGNSDQRVEGTLSQHVVGDVTQVCDANVTETVAANYTLKISGNYNVEVGGTRTDQVGGSWSRKSASVTDAADGNFAVTASKITLN